MPVFHVKNYRCANGQGDWATTIDRFYCATTPSHENVTKQSILALKCVVLQRELRFSGGTAQAEYVARWINVMRAHFDVDENIRFTVREHNQRPTFRSLLHVRVL